MFPAPKRCPQNYAPGPGDCIRDVGGESWTLRGRNSSAGAVDAPNNDIHGKQPTPHSNSAAGSSAGEDSAAENELLESANKSRELAGAPPLRMDESLREAARAHARLMIASERLDHQFSGEPALLAENCPGRALSIH